MSNEIIKILDDLGKRLGVAIDWSNKNIMPYLEELIERFIQWEITTSIVWGILGILLLSGGLIGTIIFVKQIIKCDLWDEDVFGFMIGCSFLITILGVVVIMAQIFDICEAIYLPEKLTYDYINGLMSQ